MEISSTRLLVRLPEQANIVLHVLRSGRHMSAAQQPNSGTEQEPARPAISSPDLPVAPVESFEDPVARKLAVLRRGLPSPGRHGSVHLVWSP